MDKAHQYANYDPENAIAQMNKEAADNLNPNKQHLMVKDQAIFGEYHFAPIADEKKDQLKEALNEIHKIVTPTIKQLKHTSNVAEIQDRLFRRIAPWELEFNNCIFNSANMRDTNYCADRFTDQLKGEGVEYTKKIIRDY